MSISEVKDLLTQFDQSSLKELSLKQGDLELYFSKNDAKMPVSTPEKLDKPIEVVPVPIENQVPLAKPVVEVPVVDSAPLQAEGDLVESPLVGIAYLAPAPDKPNFVSVGDSVKKGQTLLIIEAMKVMNEVPAPADGVVTEVLVNNGEMVEFGKGLVRLK